MIHENKTTQTTYQSPKLELVEVVVEGASLVLCGDRSDDMAFLLRRVFGITDGFLYGGS